MTRRRDQLKWAVQIRRTNPVRAAQIRLDQSAIRKEFTGKITVCQTSSRLQTSSPRERNRRVQPPRRALSARVPPVRRSVDPTEPDETTGAPPRRL